MPREHVMAFDASTTSVRAIIFDKRGKDIATEKEEFTQHYPNAGWVEHDADEIWDKQLKVAHAVIAKAGLSASDIAAIGITNQRETTVIWDRATGKPIHRAICWQDRRTAGICDALRPEIEEHVAHNTGLVVDAYFSGTKIKWLLDNLPGARARAEAGDLAFGTIDSWLIWKLTGGKVHVTDVTNASRTLCFNIRTIEWDKHLMASMDVPASVLPEVKNTSEVYGLTAANLFDAEIPVAAAAGDQQAALFGQVCFDRGMAKCSYGTAAALMMNTGDHLARPGDGLIATAACSIDNEIQYAVEGVIFICGAAVQWLRDELKLINSSEEAVCSVADTNGVYFVPAFVGLSAPTWDQYARGTIVGLTRGANREHLIRATLESMAYQVHDVVRAVESVSGLPLRDIRVDGGACQNEFVMQFQSDLSGLAILRPTVVESASRGAAFLAGLAVGVWSGRDDLAASFELDRRFEPKMERAEADKLYAGWQRALERSHNWVEQSG